MQKTNLRITVFSFLVTSFLLILLILYTGCELYTASLPKNKNSQENPNEDSGNNSSSNSSSTWTTQLLGAPGKFTESKGITSDANGNIYVTGYTYGDLDGQTKKGICDLFVVKYNMNGKKQWTRLLGVIWKDTYAESITSDSDGNVYITGRTDGDLNGLTKTGDIDLFIVKYDTNGNKLWIRLLGVNGAETCAYGITSNSDGNVYITGRTDGDLNGLTKTGDIDLFIVKYDTNGNKLWIRLLGASGAGTLAYGISSDSNGNVYTTGLTDGDLDGNTLTGTQDLFVVKYNANGEKKWTKLLGAFGAHTEAYGITSDSNGNIYTTGYTNGDFYPQALTGTQDLFIVKYNADGNKLWIRLLGADKEYTQSISITSDSNGNVYTTGWTQGNLDTQGLTGDYDLFVVKYDANGNKLWTRLLGVPGQYTEGRGITSYQNGNLYTTGVTTGNLDGQTLTGIQDLFIVKYNADGEKQ